MMSAVKCLADNCVYNTLEVCTRPVIELRFNYSDAPMCIDYKEKSNEVESIEKS